jgi:hypothetical protein
MVKKILTALGAIGLLVSFGGTAFSGTTSDNGPGCGLGKVAWEGSSADSQSIGPQLLMSTTNNTVLPWQAFGITSGNFGCTNNGKLWAQHKTTMFANINFDNLAQEMAQGRGEHLASLATLMGVPEEQREQFFAMAQQNYANLIQTGETTPVAVIKALHESIETHPLLAQTAQ